MLALTLLVRDEEDIVEANLDFHFSAGVDFAIVTDHRSVDSTNDILARYEREGRVRVIREDAHTYEQFRWVTRMARMAHELGASWVINADADEFWWPAGGDLKSTLATLPETVDVIVADRTDFPPLPGRDGVFWQRQIYREAVSLNLLGAPLPPKVAHRARPDIQVAQGNHSVWAPDLGQTTDMRLIEIFHFPMRTYEQFERKIVNGGAAYEAPGSPPHVGGTWRAAYHLWRDGRLRSEVYEPRLLTPERLAARLEAGAVLEDTRLRDKLAAVTPLTTE